MYADSDGDNPIAIILGPSLIVWTVTDIVSITSGCVYFDSRTREIKNSYKVQNPIVMLGYSIFLTTLSKDAEYFNGSYAGVFGEWMWHNLMYDSLCITQTIGVESIFGYKTHDLMNRASEVGLGRNIFEEDDLVVLLPSIAYEMIVSPGSVVIDLFQYMISRNTDKRGA